ncbi:MAG: hypothetical protein AAFP19_11685 [Bacteroidota bacterium]
MSLFSLLLFAQFFSGTIYSPPNQQDYTLYHQSILKAETEIAQQNYEEAIALYANLFEEYDFVFLKDYKIATQVAIQLERDSLAWAYLQRGMAAGWTLSAMKKNKMVKRWGKDFGWKRIKKTYEQQHALFSKRLNTDLRKQTKQLMKKDQRKAFGAFIRIRDKAQDRYAEKQFAPHSEQQMLCLKQLMASYGYPGEQLVGTEIWASTILSHHNSISTAYNRADTIYPALRGDLQNAVKRGEMSPYAFALVADWQIAVSSDRQAAGYGYINELKQADLAKADQLRAAIGIRSIALRNQLIEIEQATGMNFYLFGAPWVVGKIEPRS